MNNTTQPTPQQTATGCGCLVATIVAISLGMTLCTRSNIPPPLSEEQKTVIISDLRNARYPEPQSIELNKETGFVVAIFEVFPEQIPDGGKTFASDALLRIRERLLPAKVYKNFRVTLNAPSTQHTGIVERYGSARLLEDSSGVVDWQQGK